MIEANALTKRCSRKAAVDDLTFLMRAGMVTGLLGPNGAAKTATMRMILGLDFPTRGMATVGRRRYDRDAS
ncbi:ATP-binding cassette domain-containing protein [Actinoplanes sandaracinus]|uniref:ATP-binding cassette domain-containing protein n=1 Tax=Actinoplanes sandaracinus TaxID=3045177 RepID=UPI003898D642